MDERNRPNPLEELAGHPRATQAAGTASKASLTWTAGLRRSQLGCNGGLEVPTLPTSFDKLPGGPLLDSLLDLSASGRGNSAMSPLLGYLRGPRGFPSFLAEFGRAASRVIRPCSRSASPRLPGPRSRAELPKIPAHRPALSPSPPPPRTPPHPPPPPPPPHPSPPPHRPPRPTPPTSCPAPDPPPRALNDFFSFARGRAGFVRAPPAGHARRGPSNHGRCGTVPVAHQTQIAPVADLAAGRCSWLLLAARRRPVDTGAFHPKLTLLF